jgi:threonylcarbamoyladenosine tRNA methylthiotransferase MtaB
MGRPYKAENILEAVEKLRGLKDDPFLASDIIAGFPGETDAHFKETLRLCRAADFAFIHAFPYSKRPGTAAAAIRTGLVSQRTACERVELLTAMAQQGRSAYIRRWQGKMVEAVVIEEQAGCTVLPKEGNFSPFFPALTDNYIRVLVAPDNACTKPAPGAGIHCRITANKASLPNGFDAHAVLCG